MYEDNKSVDSERTVLKDQASGSKKKSLTRKEKLEL